MALVAEGAQGSLHVKVLEGRDLLPCDRNGLSDPFVVVTFGPNKAKTKHLRQTLDPIWTAQDRAQFEFKVDSKVPGIIQFELFDWNRLAASKRMGMVEIKNLKDLLGKKKTVSGWFPLVAKKGGDEVRGELKLQLDLKQVHVRQRAVTMDGSMTGDESELEAAIKACDKSRVEALIETEDVNRQDDHGYTPLHQAAILFAENDSEILCAVLNHPDIDVNLENADGNTPLHYFCSKYRSPNCGDAFAKFVEKGADVNKQNRTGETPLHKAIFNNSVRVLLVNLLVQANADVNKQTEFGETALHYAVRLGRLDLVSILLKAGADLSVRGKKEGKTALELARDAKQDKTSFLIERAQEVYDFLTPMGLEKYGALFIKEEIYKDLLPDLDEETLTSIGIRTTGHRVKLLNAAKQLRAEIGEKDDGKVESISLKTKKSSAAELESETAPKDEDERNKSIEQELAAMKYLKKSNWVLHHSELEFVGKIGTGAAGIVYRGLYQENEVAIKVLKTDQSDKEVDEFKKEFQIMSSIEHPNLVFFFGAALEPRLCMVLEMCSKGALYDVLNSETTTVGWERAFAYAKDMTRGLNALHTWDPQIVHRDFKSLNLLVNKDDIVKVADFGLSRFNTDTQKETLAKMRGTFAYVAPEVYFGKPFSTKSDVFSVSLVLWELATRVGEVAYERPYAEYKNLHFDFQIIIQTAKKGLRPTIKDSCPEEFADLIRRCWSEDSDSRPECVELLDILDKMHADFKGNPTKWNSTIKAKK